VTTSTTDLSVYDRPPVDAPDGPAPTYLLVHGSMDRATSFRRLEMALPEATIISYDRRGYAGSLDRGPTEDFAPQVDDLVEVLDGRAVVAFGHSFGAGVVAAAAVRRPDLIRAAVLWEPPMPWRPGWPTSTAGALALDGTDPAETAEAFMIRLVGRRIWDRLPPSTHAARRAEGATLVAEMRSLRSGPPWDPTEVTVPVIIGSGTESHPHQQRNVETIATEFPDAERVAVDGAHHGAHLSHPAEIAALMRRARSRADGRAGVAAATVRRAHGPAAESSKSATDEESPS
jgi:pimeloyl-ACP methyl ester carboxylesterase